MTRLFRFALLAALAAGCASAPPKPAAPAAPAAPALPPLIDRELFFGDPEISGAQLSPDGAWMSFMKPLDGTRNLWVKRREEPFDKARPLTAETKRPVPASFWSRDSRFVLFVQDQGGDENFNVYAVDPSAAPKEGAKVPEARALTDLKGVRAQIYAVPKAKPGLLFVGLNDRDPAWHDLYEVEIATGKRTLLRKNDQRFTGFEFDHAGALRLAQRVDEKGNTEVLRLDEAGMQKIYGCGVLESCGVASFHKDGKRAYLVTNTGAGDLERLELMDVATGAVEPVESDPKGRVDLTQPIFSSVTDELVGTVYNDERLRFYWRDPGYAADFGVLQARFPDRDVLITSESVDGRFWLASVTADVEPGESWIFDRQSKQAALQYRVRERLPREALSSVSAIRYPSSDGLEIPAFLTLPRGAPSKGLPLIVLPHGGPWARTSWGFSGLSQFLANRGYAVLSPNFRGSTGYGKKFLDAGNGQWGDKMQDDLTWGVKHLVAQGTVDPKRVGILGGSYGGYATLAGLTFTPDLYAAGVAIVAPSNLLTLLATIPPYWEQIRVLFHTRMGDPNTAEGKAQLVRQSPLTHAAKIKTPLMVVQGANDPRVKKAEADQIVIALRDRSFPVEYILAPDEGHGFQRPVNNLATFAAAEKFLAKHLGGRFEEAMTPEVAQRLKELTVDPRTVELAKAPTAPPAKAASPLVPGTSHYAVALELGPQKMSMTLATEVKEAEGGWLVTDTTQSPQGSATDRVWLDKQTLALRKRAVAQGPVTIDLAFAGGKATGEMKMGGNARPIAADVAGDVFADGAGAHQAVAALPLAAGYEATFQNFDLRKGKPKAMALAVAGAEEVAVPAGKYTAWKVTLTDGDDGSVSQLWIDQKSRAVVRSSTKAVSMGGAVITAELTKQEPPAAAPAAKAAPKKAAPKKVKGK